MRTTPSIVAQTKTGERVVGVVAKRQAITNQNTIYRLSASSGTTHETGSKKMPNQCPLKHGTQNGGVEVKIGDKWSRPKNSAMILGN